MKSKLYILLTMFLACTMQVKGSISVTSSESVYVGSGTNSSSFVALCPASLSGGTQALYTADEIGRGGIISSIAFQISSATSSSTQGSVKIYLAETDQTTLTSDNMLKESDMTLVYSNASYLMGTTVTGWESFTLQNSFKYSGVKNLVVAVSTSKSASVTKTYKCHCSSEAKYAIRAYSTTDKSLCSAFYTAGMASSTYIPNIRLGYATAVTSTVGAGSELSRHIGICPYFKNSSCQTLYTASEIGSKGNITSITYRVDSVSATSALRGEVHVYLGTTTNTYLNSSNMLKESDFTEVYSNTSFPFARQKGYVTIDLNTPYYYDGTKNLVIAISTKVSSGKSVYYQGTTASVNRTVYHNSNTEADPAVYSVPWATTGIYSSTIYPYVKFSIDAKPTCSLYQTTKGTGTTTSLTSGLNPYYKYYSAQILYPADSLRLGQEIEYLGFDVAKAEGSVKSLVKIWLAETEADTLTIFNRLMNMTEVYNDSVQLGSKTGYQMLRLKQPYTYTGRRSLVIAVSSSNPNGMPKVHYNCRNLEKRCVSWMDDTNTNCSNPFNTTVESSTSYVPNVRFYYTAHSYSEYTPQGLGVCSKCNNVLKYAYQQPPYQSGYGYCISNVNQLNWLVQHVAWNSYSYSTYYIMNDLDLSTTDWTPIGTMNSPLKGITLRGYNCSDKIGHRITGLGSSQSLIGYLGSNAVVQSLRLETGHLVDIGEAGKVSGCLNMGGTLFVNNKASVRDSSFYYTSAETTDGGRTFDQMKSGAVTYGLNHAATSGGATYYQKINTDNYPVFDSSRGTVYRGTKCEKYYYSNTSSDQGKDTPHSWQNAICTACSAEPTTFKQNVTLSDSYVYRRTKNATMYSSTYKLTYTRTFNNTECWQEMYVPFSFKYDATMASKLDVAEIYAYGVKEDTNHDGNVTSADDKMVIVRTLDLNAVTEPNMPYLIKAKSTGSYTFTSVDGFLSKAESNSVIVSTMKEEFMVQGHYTGQTVYPENSGTLLKLNTSADNFTGASTYTYVNPFRLHYQVRNKNGNNWSGNLPVKITHTDMPTFIIDDESGASYDRTQEITVNNFTYNRDMSATVDKWQPLYVPFDIKLTSEFLAQADFATIDGVTSDGDMDCIVVTKRNAGYTIPANTPSVLRIHVDELALDFNQVTLKPAENKSLTYSTANHTYTFTGVYAPFQTSEFTWYAIAKDGLFHPAKSTAKLPAYRFYMTVDGGASLSSDLRLSFYEQEEEETGIRNFGDEASQDVVYSLDGRRVDSESLQPGIYVKGGKKFRVQ